MRVTKNIAKYIEEEVRKRIAPKYEGDKQELERREEARDKFINACQKVAKEAYDNYFNEHFNEIAEFCKDNRENEARNVYYNPVPFFNAWYEDSVYKWQCRMNKEVEEVTENIIVNLELGGAKEDLVKMLEEVK